MGEPATNIEFEVEKVIYPDTQDTDEQRRAFVLGYLASAEIDARILLENMAMVCEWLKNGTLPAKAESKRKLEAVRP